MILPSVLGVSYNPYFEGINLSFFMALGDLFANILPPPNLQNTPETPIQWLFATQNFGPKGLCQPLVSLRPH